MRISSWLVGAALLVAAPVASADYRLAPEPEQAGDGIELTPWLKVKPWVRLTTQYTSNLLQERSRRVTTLVNGTLVTTGGKENDVAWSLIEGVELSLKASEGTYLDLGYNVTELLYAKHGDLNTVEQRARFAGAADLGKLTLSGRGTAAWGISNTDPQYSGRVRNFRGTGSAEARYQLNKVWGALAEGKVDANQNFPRELEPTNAATWGGDVFLTVAPNISTDVTFLAGGGYREIHYFDRKALNPDISLASVLLGAELALGDSLQLVARGGYEIGWVKTRRRFPRGDSISNGLRGSLSLVAQPLVKTQLTLGTSHLIRPSGSAAYQRETVFFARVTQELPLDLRGYVQAAFALQQPRHNHDLRSQSYRAGLGWARIEHLEIGADAGYARTSSLRGGFEVWDVTVSLTFRY